MTTLNQKTIRKLLAEIKRLKLENERLRQAAGIMPGREPGPSNAAEEVLVSAEEKMALLSKSS